MKTHNLSSHPPTGNLVIIRIPCCEVLAALGQQILDIALILEHEVQVTLRRRGEVPSRPLHSHVAELGEGLDQRLLGDVPGHAAEEDLGGVGGVRRGGGGSVRQLAGPGARGLAVAGRGPVQPGRPLQLLGVRAVREGEAGHGVLGVAHAAAGGLERGCDAG